jgi:nicotinate-nucleotide adenylyltransferase
MKREIVAIYGGTFSPPHIGHVHAAEALSAALSPDRFMIIVDNLPPHKELDGGATAEHRLAMAKLAFGHIPRVEISDMEIRRGGRSYTAETLTLLSEEDRELYFLCGTDMFLSLPTWRNPAVIFEKATICLVRREEDSAIADQILKAKETYEKEFSARIRIIDSDVLEISSSELRSELSAAPWRAEKKLPASVYTYILEQGLWPVGDRETILSSLREDVRLYMSAKRYQHTLGVEKMVLRISAFFKEVDSFQLSAAALLHDITKELCEEEQRSIVDEMQIKLSKSQENSPAVLHSFTAEYRIKKEFSYFGKMEKIISAIRAHTTGGCNMSLFDKILFVADYIEEGREYPRCTAARERFFFMLESGVLPSKALDTILLQILESTIRFLTERGFCLCEDTVYARDEILSTISSN